ncbi:MAG: hypothetical protein KA715_12965 [Xanthomonadaceae bacterium]|nr:hypothetical protein [Xanthomonadaceae bacterium]
MALLNPIQVVGTNAWFKPIKFALSIGIYVWTLGFFSRYLVDQVDLTYFNWTLIISLGFEIIYIAFQAARGQASHFNVSTPIYSFLYTMMALGASLATLAGAWMGYQFFTRDFPEMNSAFLWSVRLSIVIFVVFAFQGFAMGSRMTHTIGAKDGGPGVYFLNWSKVAGDLRIAHFLGMHSIQIIPLITYLWIRDMRMVFLASTIHFILTMGIFIRALGGKPLY